MSKRSRIAPDFTVSAEIIGLAQKNGWPDPRREVEAFKDYHLAHGSLMLDWEAAFRTWLRRAVTMGKSKPMQPPTKPSPPVKSKQRPLDTAKARNLIKELADRFDVRKKV